MNSKISIASLKFHIVEHSRCSAPAVSERLHYMLCPKNGLKMFCEADLIWINCFGVKWSYGACVCMCVYAYVRNLIWACVHVCLCLYCMWVSGFLAQPQAFPLVRMWIWCVEVDYYESWEAERKHCYRWKRSFSFSREIDVIGPCLEFSFPFDFTFTRANTETHALSGLESCLAQNLGDFPVHLHWAPSEGIWNVFKAHRGSTKVVVSSCSLRPKHWSALQRKPWTLTLNRKFIVSEAHSARDRLDFWCSSTMAGSTSHRKFWGILSLSRLSAKSQHTTWRGSLLRAVLTNQLAWDSTSCLCVFSSGSLSRITEKWWRQWITNEL